jgi:hypothetical protein
MNWLMRDQDAGHPLLWLPPATTILGFFLLFLARHSPEEFWAFNLWDYLPSTLSYLFMGATIIISLPPVLLAFARILENEGNFLSRIGFGRMARMKWILVPVSLFVIFWVFQERRPWGDWYFLQLNAEEGNPFEIKEAGGSFLFFLAWRISQALDIEYLSIIRFFISLSGVVFFVFVWKIIALLFDTQRERILAILFLCACGFVRLFFGHIEIYAFLLASICAYMYFAFLFIQKKTDVLAPALALGVSIWFHLSAVFLVPSFLYMALGQKPDAQARRTAFKSLAKGGFFLILPFSLFFILLELAGYTEKIIDQYSILLGFLNLEQHWKTFPALMPLCEPRTFKIFGNYVTQYHLFSNNHLLFLFNSNFLLSAFGLPTLGAMIPAFIKNRGMSDPRFLFLCAATSSMLIYSLIIYPVYWAYDWDLFSATAFCCAILAIYTILRGPANQKIVTYLVIYFSLFSFLYVSLPFILFNSTDHMRHAGVFAKRIDPFVYIIKKMGNPDVIYEE